MDEWWLGLCPVTEQSHLLAQLLSWAQAWACCACTPRQTSCTQFTPSWSWEEQWEVGRKMDLEQPEKKVWKMPELVERLLLFLDLPSTLHLVQADQIDKHILRESLSSKVWKKLIKQSTFRDGDGRGRKDVRALVTILKRTQPKDLDSFLLPLLDHICESFPCTPWQAVHDSYEVQMNCPCQEEPHKISLSGFLLLEEEVEGPFGTALQSLKSVKVEGSAPFSVLSSRMSRQHGLVTLIQIGCTLDVEDNADVQACVTLLQAQQVSISLTVYGSGAKENKEDKKGKKSDVRWEVDEEGWEALARAMQVKPNGVQRVEVSRDWLAQLRREDTKAIWEAVGEVFIIHQSEDVDMWDERWSSCRFVEKPGPDRRYVASWAKLEGILDMSKDEFDAKLDPDNEEFIYGFSHSP